MEEEKEEEEEEEEERNGEVSGKETSDKEENGTISEEKENDTAKSPSIDSSLAEDKETKSANSKTNQDDKPHSEDTDSTHTETDKPHKEADKPHKEVDKPGRRKSAEKSPKKGTTENSPAESKENEKDTEKEERVKEKVTPKGAQSDEIEKAEKVNPKEATSKTENSDGKEGGKADVEGLVEDGKTEYANEDKSPDAPEATDKDSEQDPLESDSEDILDEKEGVLTVNGRPKVFPVEEPPKAEDKSPEYKKSQDLSEIMLANNTEITICKTPLVSAASDGKLRRLSSGSSGSAKFCAKGSPFAAEDSVNPGRPTASAESDSLAGRKASEAPLAGRGSGAAPGDSDDALDGEKVSEAELMLAKCTDGEITITKSSGEVAAPRLRSRELKRSLSSEGGGGEDGGVGESRGEMERESKRAHLSEEDLVTEQFDVDLVDPIEGEEDERERLVRDFVDSASKSVVEMTANYAKLKKEIHVLSELAQAKELEWNSILRLKKLKEEMWERLARKMKIENVLNNTKAKELEWNSILRLKKLKEEMWERLARKMKIENVLNNTKEGGRLILPKPTSQLAQSPAPSPNTEIILAEGRQGRIKDVQTIIADYRSKNPNETHSAQVPKIRGRRSSTNSSRGSNHSSGSSSSSAPNDALSAARYANPSLLSMANLALGSGGGQVRNGGGGGGGSQQQQLDVQLNYLNNVQGEVPRMLQMESLEERMRKGTLRWYGHMKRMNSERLPKKMYEMRI
ncbi:DNA ligase 1 [Diaphorina citri]|uniref:DNA ligase 1 n=1 Tax=Diaphorina citri TaxID=121845 RepID=A0A3Q0JDN7_DIACI|nr:DNA ligase 1 [Diaphorina citri]